MIFKTLSDLLQLDDERFDKCHIDAINKTIAHDGNAQVTVTLNIKPKAILYAEVNGEDARFPSFEVERKVKVSRPIQDGKEQVALGYVKKKVYRDQDGEIVTRDELPIHDDETPEE